MLSLEMNPLPHLRKEIQLCGEDNVLCKKKINWFHCQPFGFRLYNSNPNMCSIQCDTLGILFKGSIFFLYGQSNGDVVTVDCHKRKRIT